MKEFFYIDRAGRLLGSVMACNFRDAHAWLGLQGIPYHSVSMHKPRTRKSRDRRLATAWA